MKFNNVRLLKLSLKPCSLFHNFKTRTGDFSNLVAMCFHIKVCIKRRKCLREDFSRSNKTFGIIFLHRLAKKFKNVRLWKVSLKPCLFFHNFKTRKGDFGNLTNLCLRIKVDIKWRK